MVSAGGQVRPTLGNTDTNTVLASGSVISGTIYLPGDVVIGGNLIVSGVTALTGDVNISGNMTASNVSGLLWRGRLVSGQPNLISGWNGVALAPGSPRGYMEFQTSGQRVYIPYWVSG